MGPIQILLVTAFFWGRLQCTPFDTLQAQRGDQAFAELLLAVSRVDEVMAPDRTPLQLAAAAASSLIAKLIRARLPSMPEKVQADSSD